MLRPDLRPDRTRGRPSARGGAGRGSPATAAPPTRSRGPGGAGGRGAGRQPRRLDVLPDRRPAPAGRPAPPGLARRVRRRHHHRGQRARGPAGARSGRSARGRGRHRGRHAPAISGRTGVSARPTFGPRAFVRPNDRLASVHGVRPGPWLRRQDTPVQALWRQADASRRRSGPRKARPAGASLRTGSRSRCGRRKSCVLAVRCGVRREKGSSGGEAANPSAGDCGVEDQVGRAGSILPERCGIGSSRPGSWPAHQWARPGAVTRNQLFNGRFTWKLWSRVDAANCLIGSESRRGVVPTREARPSSDCKVESRKIAQSTPARPSRPGGADGLLEGARDPGRGRCGQDGCARPRPRQDGPRCVARRPPSRAPRPARLRWARRSRRRRTNRRSPRTTWSPCARWDRSP